MSMNSFHDEMKISFIDCWTVRYNVINLWHRDNDWAIFKSSYTVHLRNPDLVVTDPVDNGQSQCRLQHHQCFLQISMIRYPSFWANIYWEVIPFKAADQITGCFKGQWIICKFMLFYLHVYPIVASSNRTVSHKTRPVAPFTNMV